MNARTQLQSAQSTLKGLYLVPVFLVALALELSAQKTNPTGQQMVDALHSAFGEHHARAVHAKGIIVTGTFTPAPTVSAYTTAAHLQPSTGELRVIARFSDFTGIPDIPDADPHGNPKGFAIRFVLPDGQLTDIVSHSFNGFPVATAAEFRELLLAVGRATGQPADPLPLNTFLASHPIAKAFLTSQKPAPQSWATTPYFGVNAFRFTNSRGDAWYIRYRFVPLAGEAYITTTQEHALAPDYLIAEMQQRLSTKPVQFRMQAQLAAEGDDFRNPSIAWPDTRTYVDLGLVSLTSVAAGPDVDRNLQFEPAAVIPGIAVADPMLNARKTAYPISASERQ